MTRHRVRFVLDEDAQFEECNGESRPLTADEYAGNEYMGCPVHPRGFDGDKSADTTAEGQLGQGVCKCGRLYEPIPYTEYLAYYGNPDRHVYFGYEVQEQCSCCQAWQIIDSLWNIDMMDNSPELKTIKRGVWYDLNAPEITGYFRTLVNDIKVKG